MQVLQVVQVMQVVQEKKSAVSCAFPLKPIKIKPLVLSGIVLKHKHKFLPCKKNPAFNCPDL